MTDKEKYLVRLKENSMFITIGRIKSFTKRTNEYF